MKQPLPTWPRVACLLLTTLWASASAQAPAGSAKPEIYVCTDAQGRKYTSDRWISNCSDREQTILNPSGTVKAKVGPALSAQERSRLEAEKRAAQQELARQEEEKKRDRSLFVRYPDLASHQKERNAALANVARVKQASTERIQELQAELKRLDEEMAFYQKDPRRAPAALRRQLDDAKQSLVTQQKFQQSQDAEIQRINARFDNEQKRLTPFWRQAAEQEP